MNTSGIHPEPFQIVRIWQTYLNNVDPLMKVTHTSSLQPRILEAAGNMENASPTLQALMLSIYCTSVLSLTADDCRAFLGLAKDELLSKYQSGCQQALLNCGFLRSEDRESLTALYLFLVSIQFSLFLALTIFSSLCTRGPILARFLPCSASPFASPSGWE